MFFASASEGFREQESNKRVEINAITPTSIDDRDFKSFVPEIISFSFSHTNLSHRRPCSLFLNFIFYVRTTFFFMCIPHYVRIIEGEGW